MTSEGLFDGIYARGGAAGAVADRAWVQAMLDVEAALARATAPAEAAEAIAAACRADAFDLTRLSRAAAASTTPVLGLVKALREAVGPQAADHVHTGATSQDVLDTAAMLVARAALDVVIADARSTADAAAALADAHRATPIMGRTLLQPAMPTAFGLKAAGWMTALDQGAAALAALRDGGLPVQMGGPVGHRAPAVAARVAAELGLLEPPLPWHTDRTPVARLAGALGALAGSLAKMARDVTLLAQGELAELREGADAGRGRSSAMAHKRNPVAAVSVLACAGRIPGLVATLLAGMVQEQERAAGAWQAEWGTLGDVLALTGSAAAWGRDLLEHIEVDAARMAAGAGEAPDLGAAGALIDRALEARAR